MRLPFRKLAQVKCVLIALNSKERCRKSAIAVHALQHLRRTLTFHIVVLLRTIKKFTKNQNARAETLFYSSNFLFGEALGAIAVAIMVC